MKQQSKIRRAEVKRLRHITEVAKIENQIASLRKSMRYHIVQKGISAKGSCGILTLSPCEENERVLTVNIDQDFNEIHGARLRYQSVVKLRNYLNDFLKTRPEAKNYLR